MSNPPKFLTGSTLRHVTVMTLTASVGLTFMFLIDVATLFWVSRIGVETNVAALGFAWTIQFFTISVGIGLLIATTALVSRSLGQRDKPKARRQGTSAMVITGVLQSLVALLVVVFRMQILRAAGAQGDTLQIAADFLLISMPSLPLMAVGMVGSAILRAEGDAMRGMLVTMGAGVIAMVLDPLFIFGFGLGLDGAAIVVVISRGSTALLAIWFVIKVHDLAAKPSFTDVRAVLVPFFVIAGPAIATQVSTPFGNYILTRAMAEFGDGAVAGWAVVSRLTVLAFGGIFALSGAVGGIFGQNFGAGRIDRVQSTFRDALIFCFIYTMLAWVGLFLLRGVAIDAFHLSDEGARIVRIFSILAGGFVFTGFLFVANATFNNLGKPLWSTGFNWARDGVLMLPAVWLMTHWFAAPGVLYAQALVVVLVGSAASYGAWRFVKGLEHG